MTITNACYDPETIQVMKAVLEESGHRFNQSGNETL